MGHPGIRGGPGELDLSSSRMALLAFEAGYHWRRISENRSSIIWAISFKAQWTLEEIGWKLLSPGDVSEWDGLSGWYTRYIDRHPEIARANRPLRDWYTVAIAFKG